MRKRLIQILGFLLSTLGWVFVLCTIAMDYWRITQYGGQGGSFVITTLWYWSNLWKDCSTDTTAVDDCREYPTLWSVTPSIHAVRGLIICGIGLGFLGVVLCFLGMECTYIGGAEKTKDKQLFAGALIHFAGGVSDISAYGIYSNSITRIAFAPSAGPGVLRYDVGPPIFLGFVGSSFIMLGAVLYAVTVFRVICPQSKVVNASERGIYLSPRSRGQTLYSGRHKPSKHYGTYIGSAQSSSSRISKLSQTTLMRLSERDAFV